MLTRRFHWPLVVALTVGGAALLLALASTPAASIAHAQAPTRIDVLIGFRSTPGPQDQAVVRSHGGIIRHSYRLVPAVAASIPEAAVAGLLAHPRVTRVELDGTVHALSYLTELNNTWGVKRIGAGTVHDDGNLGTGVAVAVIDSGMDYGHPDLGSHYAGGHDFVNDDDDPWDDNGHGTHVAGSVAGVRNGEGVVGVSPEVQIHALKVLSASGSGAWSGVIAALEWVVDNGIRITNNSYGSGTNPGSIVQAAFDASAAAGVLHVAAAGNSGNCGGRGNSVGYPARFASVVAVAATNQNDARPCFSSTGPDVELAAPGVSIRSTVPGGGYADYHGTSMASPHVAGAAALVAAAVADESGWFDTGGIREILKTTALDLGADGHDSHYGFGLVQAALAVAAAGEAPGAPPDDDPGDDPTLPGADTVGVSAIGYATSGGRTQDRHLAVTVGLVDEFGNPVSGASVSIDLLLNGALYGSGTATTGTDGTVTFNAQNAPSGCYTTTVTAVSASGLAWNGTTPVNGPFCK